MEQRMIAKQASSLESALATSDSYVVPSRARSDSLSWTATSGSNGDAVDETRLIDAARDDNSYMVKQQHQRLLLANSLAAHEQDQDFVSRQQLQQQQNCLTLDNNHRIIHQPVIGRSAIDQLERMKRRRSIGSSMVLARQSSVNKPAGKTLPSSNNVHFDDRQRAKSRSQTTIYYGQSQDPFRAVPFNSNQSSTNLTGYLSDGTSMVNPTQQRSTRAVRAPPFITEIYPDYDNRQDRHHPSHPSNTINTVYLDADRGNRWSLTNEHRNAPPPPPSRTHLLPSHHAVGGIKSTCQFDPRNSTQQLSDLIQKKHQQHIEQANITKASLQSPTTLDQFDNDRVIWK